MLFSKCACSKNRAQRLLSSKSRPTTLRHWPERRARERAVMLRSGDSEPEKEKSDAKTISGGLSCWRLRAYYGAGYREGRDLRWSPKPALRRSRNEQAGCQQSPPGFEAGASLDCHTRNGQAIYRQPAL